MGKIVAAASWALLPVSVVTTAVGAVSSLPNNQSPGIPAWGWIGLGYIALAIFLGYIGLTARAEARGVSQQLDDLLHGVEKSLIFDDDPWDILIGVMPYDPAPVGHMLPTVVGNLQFHFRVFNDSRSRTTFGSWSRRSRCGTRRPASILP